MIFFEQLTSNYVLNASVLAWFSAQLIKTLLTLIVTKELRLERMVGSGGMPSAHSATVCALTVSMSRVTGIGSPEFALAVMLAAIVMYDAMGVRRAAGEHAKVLNVLLDEWDAYLDRLFKGRHKDIREQVKDNSKSSRRRNKSESKEDVLQDRTSDLSDIGVISELESMQEPKNDEESANLKEFLGHTPIEVLAGALLGILVALILPK